MQSARHGIELIVDDIVEEAAAKEPKKSAKKKRAPRRAKKNTPKKTTLENAMQELETESIPLDNDEEWGGYID